MMRRHSSGWQLILADLALILFLVTLAALAAAPPTRTGSARNEPQVAQAQALFRYEPNGPSLNEWLALQHPDPRATLTVIGQHSAKDRQRVWSRVQAMAQNAEGQGYPVRVIIKESETSDIYASLAYDSEIDD